MSQQSIPPGEGTTLGSLTVRNEQLHYAMRGEGSRTILCLPGATGSAAVDFLPQFEYFGRNGSGYTVVGMDPLGYGASRPPERVFPVQPDHFLKLDAVDGNTLMQALSIKKFSILGWCSGGASAIILAALYPESVEKVVVWGSKAYITEVDLELLERTRDVENWSERMRDTRKRFYGDSLQMVWSNVIDGMWATFERRNIGKGGDLCMDEVKKVLCPTLILHGLKDAMCQQFHPEYLHEKIKGSKLVTMAEGKHNLHLRYSEEFNKLVDDFLRE